MPHGTIRLRTRETYPGVDVQVAADGWAGTRSRRQYDSSSLVASPFEVEARCCNVTPAVVKGGLRYVSRHASTMLEILDVGVVYPNGLHALTGATLSAAPGEIVVILGRSGAGKSTLLRCINGLQ